MSDELCINTIRVLCADIVEKAKSGHPGAPMGMAPISHVLWTKYLKFNPNNPKWINRDRFVLSNGHACALLYTMLFLSGYSEFSLDELKKFRQLGSKTPGHPESHLVKGGIEVTTGPLGQGISNAVGLAICEAHLSSIYNKPGYELFNNYTYVFAGDGCLQEGISSEACSLAGHLGLNKLIVFYDDNHITIDGNTSLSFTEDVIMRYRSYGWHTISIEHGDYDVTNIINAIEEAHKIKDKPILIKIRTTIGYGLPKQGTEKVHGNPPSAEDVAIVKKKFGFDPNKSFYVPEEVYNIYNKLKEKGKILENEWNLLFQKYEIEYPDLAKEIKRRFSNQLPDGWKNLLPKFKPEDPAKATRQFSQIVINSIAKVFPELIGGSADLNPSTLSYIDISKDFQKNSYDGRNIRFGVREHGMAAICNGIYSYGGFIPYCATFLNFIGYAMGAVRLSAISYFGVIYIMTHDSIGLGEDGPTHQPIESLMMLRAMPNILVIRPADGNETSGAYMVAIENRNRPSVICLSRQAVPNLKGSSIENVMKGAYILLDCGNEKPQLILVGTGSETHLCTLAAEQLKDIKIRVISMPCWELFEEQSIEYKYSLFPDGVPVLAVEAGSVVGWKQYAHSVIGMTTFGASAPAKDVFKYFGFTVENIIQKAKETISFYSKQPPESPIKRPF